LSCQAPSDFTAEDVEKHIPSEKQREAFSAYGIVWDPTFTKGNMLTGFSYTIHPAASKYYKEKGIKPKRW
jgi:TRAP-type uncharacterized transport system substrate-binding protein